MTAPDEKPNEEVKHNNEDVKRKRYPEVEFKEGENFAVVARLPEDEKRSAFIHIVTRTAKKEGRNHRMSVPLRAAKVLLENALKAVEVEKTEYPKSFGRIFTFRRTYYLDLRTTEEHGSFMRISCAPQHFSVFIQYEDLHKFVNSFKEAIEGVPEQYQAEPLKEVSPPDLDRELHFSVAKRGNCLKISQNSKGRKRNTTMIVPTKQLPRLQEIVADVIKKTEQLKLKDGGDCKSEEVEAEKVAA